MPVSAVSPTHAANSAISDHLTQALRETMVATAKAQTFHWNVEGMSFGPLHDLFQTIYEDHFEAQDVLAERIRAIGAHADGRLSAAVAASSIREGEIAMDARDMVRELMRDQRALSATSISVARVAETHGDLVTNDLCIERAQVHDKFAWILESHVTE